MTVSDYQKLKHDLLTLIKLNRNNPEAQQRFKKQLDELEKSRQK